MCSSGLRCDGGTSSSVRCCVSTATGVGAVNGCIARQHAIHQRAERIDVRARVELLGANLLGRHVERRADERAARGHLVELLGVAQLGQAEVEHLDHVVPVARARHQQVLRLQIAMHDARLVRLRQRVAHLNQHRRQPHERHRPVAPQDGAEILAACTSSMTRYIEPSDSPKSNTCTVLGDDSFDTASASRRKRCADLASWRQRRVQHLHRRQLAHRQVLDLVDRAHAAGADLGDHAIAPVDDGADEPIARLVAERRLPSGARRRQPSEIRAAAPAKARARCRRTASGSSGR